MEATLKQLNLDKTTWTPVKFGDIAKEPKESAKDVLAEGIEHVVGLEHIDPEDVHLRRSANLEESTTFTKKFAKGDVLFGRRRAYLKKAAQASFSGICSGDITVFRAKDGILPELLPFVVCNDKFFDYAVKHSAGGLSPRVKFKDLANYEFLLPPKDQQKQLAELLWAMDDVIEKEREVLEKIKITENVKLRDIFLGEGKSGVKDSKLGSINPEWRCVKLEELLNEGSIISHLDGNHGSFYPRNEEFVQNGVPYISANCIEDDGISLKNAKYLTEERADTITKGIARNGDILLAHNATVGPVCILRTDKNRVVLSTSLTYYRVDTNKINPLFLFYFMKSRLFQSQLEKVMSQSTRNQVPITTQRILYFIIPPIDIQNQLINKLMTVSGTSKKVESKITSSQALQKSLINQIF